MLFISTTTLVSALALCSSLTGLVLATGPKTQCVEKYLTPAGATCDSIAQGVGMSQSQIPSMNPGINCDATLPTNSSVCLRQYTPTCTLNATATDKTCDGLASKWSISVDDFVEYNDDVDQGCDNLVVGQPYCVSIQGCYPTNTNDVCQQ